MRHMTPVVRVIEVSKYHTQLANMSFEEILDLASSVGCYFFMVNVALRTVGIYENHTLDNSYFNSLLCLQLVQEAVC